jgi:hypothetical protein
MPKKNIAGAAMARGRVTYMLERARGSSHIASTRKPETRDRAIAEVLAGFGEIHGLLFLDTFRELLAGDIHRATRSSGGRRRGAGLRVGAGGHRKAKSPSGGHLTGFIYWLRGQDLNL